MREIALRHIEAVGAVVALGALRRVTGGFCMDRAERRMSRLASSPQDGQLWGLMMVSAAHMARLATPPHLRNVAFLAAGCLVGAVGALGLRLSGRPGELRAPAPLMLALVGSLAGALIVPRIGTVMWGRALATAVELGV